MPRHESIPVYTFDELSDRAKETARQWYREASGPEDFDSVTEDIERILTLLGVQLQTHEVTLMGGGKRREPNLWWNLGYSQSDGACFEGTYGYAKGAHRKIREEAPKDTELHQIADAWRTVQRHHRYSLTATVTQHGNGMYPDVEIDSPCAIGDDAATVRELVRDLCSWMYTQYRTEDEYRSADEQVDESIRANEYEFDADGNRWRY